MEAIVFIVFNSLWSAAARRRFVIDDARSEAKAAPGRRTQVADRDAQIFPDRRMEKPGEVTVN
jgi:hypothetical protein